MENIWTQGNECSNLPTSSYVLRVKDKTLDDELTNLLSIIKCTFNVKVTIWFSVTSILNYSASDFSRSVQLTSNFTFLGSLGSYPKNRSGTISTLDVTLTLIITILITDSVGHF